jgi:RND family efflux transporter MFP subunit
MSAQEVDHPTVVSDAEKALLPETPETAAPPIMRPAVRPRSLLGAFSVKLSSLVTGTIAIAGVAIYLMAQPAPRLETAAAASTASPAAQPIAAKPPSITVVSAAKGAITESVIVTGNLVPREEILVAAQIDGYAIDEILAEAGDRVEAGQVMARLSSAMIDAGLAQNAAQIARAEAAIAQSKSAIAEAEAAKEQAASAFARSAALRKDGIATAETLEQREAAARTAEARLEASHHALTVAEAEKRLAEAMRNEWMVRSARTEIKAPAGGIVSRRTARIGAIATTSGEPLFRIIRDGAIELEADAPEATLARLTPGMNAKIVAAARVEPFVAHVRLVAPEVDPTTRLGRVKIAIDPAPGLTIGAFGRASVEIASREGVLVPQSAILFSEAGPTLQVVKDGQVATRAIEIGLRTANQAEILRGVAAGEDIVATAGTFVRDGDKVTPVVAETK